MRGSLFAPNFSCCTRSLQGAGLQITTMLLQCLSNQNPPSCVTVVTRAVILWYVHMAASNGGMYCVSAEDTSIFHCFHSPLMDLQINVNIL